MAVTVDLAKALDKAFEDKSLTEILDPSPAALAGVTDADADCVAEGVQHQNGSPAWDKQVFCARSSSGGVGEGGLDRRVQRPRSLIMQTPRFVAR